MVRVIALMMMYAGLETAAGDAVVTMPIRVWYIPPFICAAGAYRDLRRASNVLVRARRGSIRLLLHHVMPYGGQIYKLLAMSIIVCLVCKRTYTNCKSAILWPSMRCIGQQAEPYSAASPFILIKPCESFRWNLQQTLHRLGYSTCTAISACIVLRVILADITESAH